MVCQRELGCSWEVLGSSESLVKNRDKK
jgi:hypothetical protein